MAGKEKKEVKNNKKTNEKENVVEHIVKIDTKETVEQNNDELNDRINRLFGDSSEPIKATKEYAPEELEEVRKKLVLLLIGLIITGVIILVILINPFDIGTNNRPKEEETKVEETPNKDEIPLGKIELNNDVVEELNNLVKFNVYDSKVINLMPLYLEDITDFNVVPNDVKMYILKKHSVFMQMLVDNDVQEYVQTCDYEGTVLSKKQFDTTVSKVFGPNVTLDYVDINYFYFGDDSIEQKLTLSYDGANYVIKCNEYIDNDNLISYVEQKLVNAIKTEKGIEIYHKILFVNQTGIYKDAYFETLISNDPNVKLESLVEQGTLYKYTFIENNNSYYLSGIEKAK